MTLSGTLQARPGGVAVLTVSNESATPVPVFNPDFGLPDPRLAQTESEYRFTLLVSYGYLRVKIVDGVREVLPRESITALATPVLQPPVILGPDESIEIELPLGSFYDLATDTSYDISVNYGDEATKVVAEAALRWP